MVGSDKNKRQRCRFVVRLSQLVDVLDCLVTRIKLDLFVLLLIREICLATGLIDISYH